SRRAGWPRGRTWKSGRAPRGRRKGRPNPGPWSGIWPSPTRAASAKGGSPMARISRARLWKYLRGFGPPLIVWGVFVGFLLYLQNPLFGDTQASDEANLQEWIREARIDNKPLPGLARDYMNWADQVAPKWDGLSDEQRLSFVIPLKVWQIKIEDFLRALAEP